MRELINPGTQEMEEAINKLFSNRKKSDLVFFYFCGHGYKIPGSSKFFLLTKETKKVENSHTLVSVVPSSSVHHHMTESNAQQQVVILDSCVSGSFIEEMRLRFRGVRAILTATSGSADDFAIAQEGAVLPVYTHYLVEGIETGAADLDNDGNISIEELYKYINEKVRNHKPETKMKPGRCIISNHEEKISLFQIIQQTDLIMSPIDVQSFTGHEESVKAVAVSPNGKIVASGSKNGEIKLWELDTGKLIRTISAHKQSVKSIAISPDGKTLVSGSKSGKVKLWEIETGELIRTISAHNQPVNSIAISPNGKTFASASKSGRVKLWEIESGEPIRTISAHTQSVNSIVISPDAKTLASASDGGKVKLWNLETKEQLLTLSGHTDAVNCVAFGLDENTLVSGSDDETVKVWRR